LVVRTTRCPDARSAQEVACGSQNKSIVRNIKTYVWHRWIATGQQQRWLARLQQGGCTSWSFTGKPLASRIVLDAYVESRGAATALTRQWGGRAEVVDIRKWLTSRPASPTRIGKRLEILHEKSRRGKKPIVPQLHVPHGLAFGSGEHATTYMLLRELTRREDWTRTTVLDLGTGSGVLALAARLFGARRIVATDFDPDAVRTARQNEALNFAKSSIHWRRGDVKKLLSKRRYGLVLANLFSGILEEAAPQIAGCVAPGGELWLSGILDSQQLEVTAAYRRQGLRLGQSRRRGKWVLLKLHA
jgi:ribosomal protein L11 methyltransferase